MSKLPRLAITIIYNGLHHLTHRGFSDFMVKHFDHWVIVEGHSKPGRSTSWCNDLVINPVSDDGTVAYCEALAMNHKNITFHSNGTYFKSKDTQVNLALALLKKKYNAGFLWQVDADEHWSVEDLEKSESQLSFSGFKQASFQFNHYVGKNLIAQGDWGSGWVNRLFLWRGQRFITHEPSVMELPYRTTKMEGIKFNHYSYVFRQDVEFKEKYYPGYTGITKRWDSLQMCKQFPQPITALFDSGSKVGKTNSQIIKI